MSKQLDWTPRQIERWWRGRRLQGKPSEMQRFRETTWRFVFYLLAFWLGLYVVTDVSIIAFDLILSYSLHRILYNTSSFSFSPVKMFLFIVSNTFICILLISEFPCAVVKLLLMF